MKIKVEGLKQLDQALGALRTKALAKGVVRRALLEAATPMHRMAQDMAPGRKNPTSVIKFGPKGARQIRQPGTTKALVQLSDKLTKRQAAKQRKSGKDFSEVYVGTRDAVAHFEEFGSANQAAQPFMRPAYEAEKVPTIERFTDALATELEKTAAREAKRAVKIKG